MNILIINCGSRAIKELSAMTKKLGAKITLVPMELLPLKSIKGYEGIIISGSPLMWSKCQCEYLSKFEFIKKVRIPVLGICFGHQTIALLYGSPIRREKLLKKKIKITFQDKDIITKGFNKSATLMEHHKEFVTCPTNFKLLATSNKDDVEIIKHPTKNIYGFQFHPEVSGKNGEKILKNFLDICVSS
ncbi:MAG: gamma-glutamyl-gamma-aminobutyrate hydrolase family protein [Patescibacteria group bacterium]|nr:gamma-glutamyl-gamma-aminobutyrate hydrolase family protein [Patescibacteria group bacterium]